LRENYFIELSRGEAVRCALGMKHERNDDFGIVATRLVRGEEIRWMIVCDGLSLSQNPHLASEAAAKAASTMIERMVIDGLSDYENVVEQSIIAAQNAVLKVPLEKLKGAKAAEKLPPGMTTITVVLLAGGKAHFGWAGDSRIYAILTQDGRCGAIRLTRDDTRLNELLDQGLSLEKATLDPNNAAMTQCLGPLDDCHSLVPHYAEIPLDQVAAVISMTDGAYFTVDPKGDDQPLDELAQLYAANITSARSLVEELTELANSRGGPDNITVAALFLKPK
jgi:serine/threonine protein phosphatase PrpC